MVEINISRKKSHSVNGEPVDADLVNSYCYDLSRDDERYELISQAMA
jgi:hypothetical protein